MQTVVIVIHLLVVLAMIGVVLLQKSEGGGLGIGGGGGFMTTRGSSNVLTKATAGLAAVFFATSLILSIIAGYDRQEPSIIGSPQPGSAAPGGNILDQLKPSAPPAPSGPQVPQSK